MEDLIEATQDRYNTSIMLSEGLLPIFVLSYIKIVDLDPHLLIKTFFRYIDMIKFIQEVSNTTETLLKIDESLEDNSFSYKDNGYLFHYHEVHSFDHPSILFPHK